MMTQSAGLKSFIELLETIGDNKYVFGDKLVEVGVSGPNMEATLAAIAMAQGELGHSRLLYNWVFDLKGLKGKKPDVKGQTGKAFNGVGSIHNWITLIAALYAVNTAVDLVLKSILQANQAKVVSRVNKLMREQKEHILYSQGWAQQLLEDKGAIPRKFKEAVREITPEVGAWLREVEQKYELFDEGFLARGSKLYDKFQEELKDVPVQVF